MSKPQSFPLRLPHSLKQALHRVAEQDGISINQFITTAVAEKIAALDTEAFFAQRRDQADYSAFERILSRSGGVPPQAGDEMPEDLRSR